MTRQKKVTIATLSIVVIAISFIISDALPSIERYVSMQIALRHEIHPIWRELAGGDIRPGQGIDDAFKDYEPTYTETYGPFTTFYFQKNPSPDTLSFSGLAILAKDGKIMSASAGSCTWTRSFFDKMSPEDHKYLSDLYTAALESRSSQ